MAADPAASSTESISSVASALASLSPRERDILRGIARGASNKEVARAHGIAETTVKIHVQHILRKLGVSGRVHAAVIGIPIKKALDLNATQSGLLMAITVIPVWRGLGLADLDVLDRSA